MTACDTPGATERRVRLGRASSRYIPNVPLTLFDRACRMPRKSLAVFLLFWRLAKMSGSDTAKLSNARLREHGITRKEKATALRHLEAAGLVAVQRAPRKSPLVRLLVPPVEFSSVGHTETGTDGGQQK